MERVSILSQKDQRREGVKLDPLDSTGERFILDLRVSPTSMREREREREIY
jgi:hypothetical protein